MDISMSFEEFKNCLHDAFEAGSKTSPLSEAEWLDNINKNLYRPTFDMFLNQFLGEIL